MAVYNPYAKMYPTHSLRIKEMDESRRTAAIQQLSGLSPQKRLQASRLEAQEAAQVRIGDTADQIKEDKLRRHAAKAQINQNRAEASNQAILAEQAANAEYVLREQEAFENHIRESAVLRQETDRVWQLCNAEALERSRFILGAVAQEHLGREALKLRQTQLRVFSQQAKEVQLRETISMSHALAESEQLDRLLLRSRRRTAYPL